MAVVVPRYTTNRELPQAPNQLPSVRQTAAPTADQLGGNVRIPNQSMARDLSNAGDNLLAVALRRREREDADGLFQAETIVKNKYSPMAADWESRKGSAAKGVVEESAAWWDETVDDVRSKLNERQQRAFDRTVAAMRQQSTDRLIRHQLTQERVSLDESANASIVGSINFAAAHADNPEAIAAARQDVVDRILTRGRLNGWADERTALEIGEKITLLHKHAVDALMRKDPALAKEYYEKHKEEIDGGQRASFEDKVDAGTRLQKVQQFADDHDPRTGVTLQEALDAARKQFDGEDERIAVAEIHSRFNERERIEKRAEEEALNDAYNEMGPTGGIGNLSPSTWARLTGEQRRKLYEQQESLDHRRAVRADRISQAERQKRADERVRQQLASIDLREDYLMEIGDGASPARMEEIAKEVQEARRRRQITPEDADRVIRGMDTRVAKASVVNAGNFNAATRVIDATKGFNARDKVLRKDELRLIIEQDQAIKARPLTVEEMRKHVNEYLAAGRVPRKYLSELSSWFDRDARYYEVMGTPDEANWIPNEPRPARSITATTTAKDGTQTTARLRPATKDEWSSLPKPLTSAEVNALPDGSRYIDPKTGGVATKRGTSTRP